MMIEMKHVIEKLNERRGEWQKIAAAAGVPYSTFEKIARGSTVSPRIDTVNKIWIELKRPIRKKIQSS